MRWNKITTQNKTILAIASSLVIIIIVALVFFPGLIESIGAAFSGQVSSCEDTPYAENCICGEGERKVSLTVTGLTRYICEDLEQLLIDPDSPTFESDAIQFSEDYLVRYCGFEGENICTNLSCGSLCPSGFPTPGFPENKCIDATIEASTTGGRIVRVRCFEVTEWDTPQGILTHEQTLNAFGSEPNSEITLAKDRVPWSVHFFVESETDIPSAWEVMSQSNYCISQDRTMKCGTETACGNSTSCTPALPMNIIEQPIVQSIITIDN